MADEKEVVRRQFGASAGQYVTSAVHAQGQSLARIVELTHPQPDWVALDISTGAGHTALALAPYVRRVVATDLTPEMLAAAEEFIRARGVTNVEFKVADAENLPFRDDEFDLVTNRLALHHYPDARGALSQVARVLKPGGLFALVDNVVPPDKQVGGYINAFEKLRDPSHHWAYPLVRLQTYLEDAGFVVEHAESSKKDLEFDAWADRMHCSPATKEKLRALLREAPEGPRTFFNLRTDGQHWTFAIEEAILIGRRP